jgi:hypothetical protein
MAERYVSGEGVREEDWALLQAMEQQDALFPHLDPQLFWSDNRRAPDR